MSTAVNPWNEQGCTVCRQEWESGHKLSLRYLGTSNQLHAHLYLCGICGAYWEELERYAHEIPPAEARELQNHGSFEPA